MPPLLGIGFIIVTGITLLTLTQSPTARENSRMFDEADQYALLLSLLAGLATSVGGIIAVLKKPDQKLLASLRVS